jgi:hypothetical protein
MKPSACVDSPHTPSDRRRTPVALKDRLKLRGVFSKRVKSPPLTVKDHVNSINLKMSEYDAVGKESSLSNHNSRVHPHDDYGCNPATEESPAQRRKSIENPGRGRRGSLSSYHSKSTEDKQLVDLLSVNVVPTMEGNNDDDDKAPTKETKEKEGSDSTVSTEDDSNDAGDIVSRALQITAKEEYQEKTRTISRKTRRKSLGVEYIPPNTLSRTVLKKKLRRASADAIDIPQSRFEQASFAPDTAMSTTPTMKKKPTIRGESSEKIGPRKTQEELAESLPNGAKKKKKKNRRASLSVVDAPRTLEGASLADTKSSEKQKKIRSSSVSAAVDTKSRRKSSNKPESPQSVHYGGAMESNDVEDEPLMTPHTNARSSVDGDEKGHRNTSSKTEIEPLTDDSSQRSPSTTCKKRLFVIKLPQLDAESPGKSPSAHRKRLSAFKSPLPLDAETCGKSPRAHKTRLSAIKPPRPPLDAEVPGKSPGKIQKERVRSEKSKEDRRTSKLSDITFSDISPGTLLNSQTSDHSQASDHTINSDTSFGNSQVAHLNENISQLKAQLETFKEQHQATNVEASRSRNELISVKLEYQKAQTQRREVRAKLQESEAIVKDKDRKIAALEKAVESQLDKVDEMEEQLNKVNDDIYPWQDKILYLDEEGRSNHHHAEKKNSQLDEQRHVLLEKRQRELDEQLHQIQREHSRLEGLRLDNNSQQESGEHLQHIESLKQIQAETAKKLSEKDESLQELQRKLEAAWQLNMDGMNSSMSTVKTGTDRQACRKKLQEEKHQLSATLEKKDETIAYMQLELNRLKKGLVASGSGDFASLAREVDARKAEAQVATSKYQGAQKRNVLLEDEIDHWKSLNCNLEDDVQAVKAEASEWKAKYEQMLQQAGISDPVRHTPFSAGSSLPAGGFSEMRAIRRRASIGGVYKGDIGEDLTDLPSKPTSGSVSQRSSSTIRDSLRELCSTPTQNKNNDGSVREGSLRGVRGMLSNWVSPLPPLPLTNNSSHLRNSNHHKPRSTVAVANKNSDHCFAE